MVMLKKESVHKSDHKKSIFSDKQYVAEGIPFRKYSSPVYLEERKHMYKGVPNGYMLNWRTFGRPEYRVVRSHKFGNTCRDCQYILQNAPGLFEQNNRYDFGPQEPKPNTSDPTLRFPREETYDKLFRPASEQREDGESLNDTLERIRAALAVRNKLPPGWTKIVEVWYQVRDLVQSRFFITYSLHRPVNGKREGEDILLKMSNAISYLLSDDQTLSEMLVFGKKLANVLLADNVGNVKWVPIEKANKADKVFYGGRKGNKAANSYEYDSFDTHVVDVEVDGGVEVGPKMGYPHFHVLLTFTHFSYLQFDYYKMKMYLEIMFKGLETHHGFPTTFKLGTHGDPFYGDNENPYVDLRLYPADNFLEVLPKYVRKNDAHEKVSAAKTQKVDKPKEKKKKPKPVVQPEEDFDHDDWFPDDDEENVDWDYPEDWELSAEELEQLEREFGVDKLRLD
jgi:hypothetical protein